MQHPEVILPPHPDYALRIKDVYHAGWERWYWLQADAHMDATDYLDKLHRRHMDEAKDRGALFIDCGDLLDVVSGRNDPRGTKGHVRKEHSADNYLDRVVDDTTDRLARYADNWLYFGRGNHDLKILKVCETDLLARIVAGVNARRSPHLFHAHLGGYGGWLRFEFRTKSGGAKQSFTCKSFHGSGGGGAVTKGIIQTNRRNAECDADIYITGHIHESWMLDTLKEGLTQAGRVRLRESTHIQLGGYKLDFAPDGAGTWHTQRGGGPKPVGGCFLRFHSPDGNRVYVERRRPAINYDELF